MGVCARNAAGTLPMAIESAIKQDFSHDLMEIIFVDDGSEDNTLRIMEDYSSKMDIPSRIFSGGWQGLGKARNTVINNAHGDYIVWLDSDEILEDDFVSTQVNLMDRNPNAGIISAKLGLKTQDNIVLLLDLLPHVLESSRQDWADPSKFPGTGRWRFGRPFPLVIRPKRIGRRPMLLERGGRLRRL